MDSLKQTGKSWQQTKAELAESVVDFLLATDSSSTITMRRDGNTWKQVFVSSMYEDSVVLRATISSSPGTLTLTVIARQQPT
jgi:hypothetical protein